VQGNRQEGLTVPDVGPVLKMLCQVRYSPLRSTCFAYVLRSINFQFVYKGHCEDLDVRLKQHNSGMTKSIRKYAPFEIAYFEETLDESIKREKYFKPAAGRRFLQSKLGLRTRSSMPTCVCCVFGSLKIGVTLCV
jgi:putative endonuclease